MSDDMNLDLEAKPDDSETTTNVFKQRVEDAIASGDPVAIARASLEVQWISMQYLKQIDWKLWEIYNNKISG
jgi:hypothetical protein